MEQCEWLKVWEDDTIHSEDDSVYVKISKLRDTVHLEGHFTKQELVDIINMMKD